ncbi:MAG: hypothetical protein CMM93_02990 [Rickettsiales bacterium]|nr:hypothetical protein [Rickettsiales bacterium]
MYQIATFARDHNFAMPRVELDEFISVTYEPENILVICPADREIPKQQVRGKDWRILQIRGPYQEGGSDALRQAFEAIQTSGVHAMTSSNFETDFLVFRDAQTEQALSAMQSTGYAIETAKRSVAI